jgi:hypothetical protein
MDYLHLSTSDVANLKESWVVLEDNISKVRKEVIVLHGYSHFTIWNYENLITFAKVMFVLLYDSEFC